jgi:hypothetical protein
MSTGSEQLVVISNGEEFFEIPMDDLPNARQDGFYLPHERGNTVVTDGTETFEIPLDVLADAEADGYRNVIPVPPGARRPEPSTPAANRKTKKRSGKRRPRSASARPLVAGLPKPKLAAPPAVKIDAGPQAAPVNVAGLRIETVEGEPELDSAPVAIDTGSDEPEPVLAAESIAIEEQVIDEDAERRREIEEQLEETEAFGQRMKLLIALHSPTPDQLKKVGRTYGLSTLLHIFVLIVLSYIALQTAEAVDGGAVIASIMGEDEMVEEAAELPQEVKIETEDTQTETANAADPAGALSDNIGAATDLAAFAGANVGGGLEGLAEALGKGVDKMTGNGEKASASFFGSKQLASRFVFVIDNSLSMTKGRFETALNELAKTVMALKPQQSYYIIFYSDTAYGLFHPQTYDDLIPATLRNKQLTIRWLLSVELVLRTDFAEALQMAFSLNPDVIFVLGDGGFTDVKPVAQVMASRSEATKKFTIHTLGMELDPRGVQNFKALSEPTGGTYRDVGVHPLGAEMARRAPRRRNSSRGPIWGIRLK